MPVLPKNLPQTIRDRIWTEVQKRLDPRRVIYDPKLKRRRTDLDDLVDGASSVGPLPLQELQRRIQLAGSNRLQINCAYNGFIRRLEPYSYRYRDKDDPQIPLLYAWCWKDNAVEAFKIRRFTMMQVTRDPYASNLPYPVEF
jgi:hypothetical protein